MASLFEDTDPAEDLDRILKQSDGVITDFLTLVADYYRLELQLRFRAGVRQDVGVKGEADILIQAGLALIDTMRFQIVEKTSGIGRDVDKIGPKEQNTGL